MKSLYIGTIPHCLTPLKLSSDFFFNRHPHKFSSPKGILTRLSKYLASPFLAIVEPEWNFDLVLFSREENDFSLRLWEKYSFFSFTCSHALFVWNLINNPQIPLETNLQLQESQPLNDIWDMEVKLKDQKNTWVLDSIIKHLTCGTWSTLKIQLCWLINFLAVELGISCILSKSTIILYTEIYRKNY